MLEILYSEEWADCSPHHIHAAYLDQGKYLCSPSTMYRLLQRQHTIKERRHIKQHRRYEKPVLEASAPNQVWSWDITYLKGPAKWQHYYLYVIIDIFSRYIVGWTIAARERTAIGTALVKESYQEQQIQHGQLKLHSDRGPSMKAKSMALLLADLGMTKSHSRPHTSNDNPFSEAQFKTLKYSPDYPGRFGCIEDARQFCALFMEKYNTQHFHSGLGMLTPHQVHYGQADDALATRDEALAAAFAAHPARFKYRQSRAQRPPETVWINPPV